jgi:hypothetical protein
VGIVITLELALSINGFFFSGKTCMLFYILILCVIRSQPIVFQDMHGAVFLINDEVRDNIANTQIPGADVLALVDADGGVCVPHRSLFETNLRVLLISSPRSKPDRRWLTQSTGEDDNAVFLVKPWSRGIFFVAMFVYIILNLFALSYIL